MPNYVSVDDTTSQAEYVCPADPEAARGRTCRCASRRCSSAARSHSDLLEVELSRRKIPFVKYGGLKFLEAAHVKDLLAVLRWADNPRNQLAAFRTLQLLPGMGPVNARSRHRRGERRASRRARIKVTPPAESRLDLPRLATLYATLCRTEPRRGPVRCGMVREWYQPHLERHLRARAHAHRRPGSAGAARAAVSLARALHHRAHARSAAGAPATCPASRTWTRTT